MSMFVYKGAPKTLLEAALTGSLVASEEIDVSNESYLSLFVTYAQSSGTEMKLVLETKPQGDDEWYQECAANTGTPATGEVDIESVVVTRTFTQSGRYALTLPCYGASKARVRVIETGTADGTVKVTAVPSRVGA